MTTDGLLSYNYFYERIGYRGNISSRVVNHILFQKIKKRVNGHFSPSFPFIATELKHS